MAILRERAGLSRRVLAELSGISSGAMQLIEYGETVQPEPETLRRLSIGLATNRATGRVDEAAATELYESLMSAAGYAAGKDSAGTTLESAISSVVQSPRQATRLAAFLRRYPNMSANQRRLVDALIDNLDTE